MELSLFLAKLMGIYLLIIAADLFLRRREFEKALKDFTRSKGLLFFSGSLSLIFGLAIILGHQVCSHDWRGIITLIGYLLVLKGIMRVAFPSYMQKVLTSAFRKGYWVIFLIIFVFGLYLTYMGFNA